MADDQQLTADNRQPTVATMAMSSTPMTAQIMANVAIKSNGSTDA